MAPIPEDYDIGLIGLGCQFDVLYECYLVKKRMRNLEGEQPRPNILMICINRRLRIGEPSCAGRGSEALADHLEKEIQSRGINLVVERSKCMAHCRAGPTIRLVPRGKFYHGPSDDEIAALLNEAETLCGTTTDNDADLTTNFLGS